ncbi:MAG: hypothetical protein IPP06_14485 [Saprospiraceae bacterium]|nr:hypothetical protein [Candidatus Vicinibacter affinis]MBK8642306.1 hypothetical protein [Candidatus Vicinibacter affinis]MBK9962486.1 hypothetical protein [Candidatus Vicinibacter affinis]
MEINEKQYIAGFNSGYLLAEYESRMITILLKDVHPINSYISGMTNGQKKHEQDHPKAHLSELDNIRQKGKLEIDRDLI